MASKFDDSFDHLREAKEAAEAADRNSNVPVVAKAATQRGVLHALIDIATSLRQFTFPAVPLSVGSEELEIDPAAINDAVYALQHLDGDVPRGR